MAAYVEFHVKGGGCAIVETGMIGAVMARGHDAGRVGTPEAPTLIVLRGGETLEVIECSPRLVLARMHLAREGAKKRRYDEGIELFVDWLTPMEAPDAPDS